LIASVPKAIKECRRQVKRQSDQRHGLNLHCDASRSTLAACAYEMTEVYARI
jgi:hypothetical protein